MTVTHTLVITVISGGREAGRRDWGGERERERGGEERLGRIDGGERWGGEMGERGGEERERERGGERGREVILLIKEVCEGQ